MGYFNNPFHASLSGLKGFSNPNRPAGSSRRTRNPRFALEGLEMRLSPSSLGVTTTAQVTTLGGTPTEPPPPDGDGTTPPIPPTVPCGPSDPA